MREQYSDKQREVLQHAETLSIDRAIALGQVLSRFDLRFSVVAKEGAPYPDGNARVPKGAAFVTYDTGVIPKEIVWRLVDKIAPTPKIDGRG